MFRRLYLLNNSDKTLFEKTCEQELMNAIEEDDDVSYGVIDNFCLQ